MRNYPTTANKYTWNVDKKTKNDFQYLHSLNTLETLLCYTYFIASHMSSPILTQFLAWTGKDTGKPETQ